MEFVAASASGRWDRVICRAIHKISPVVLFGVLALTVACGDVYRRPVDTTPAPPAGVTTPANGQLLDVVLVGNNWSGTVTVFEPVKFHTLAVIDVVPDWNDRVEEIKKNSVRAAGFKLIRTTAGEGHHQLVDDVFMSKDGRHLFASRPSFADVIAIDITTRKPAWRTPVEGGRADHAALSPDEKTLLVSASTAKKVHAIDTMSRRIVGFFESGDEPHEGGYSTKTARIYHASIGRVFLPPTTGPLDFLQGERVFQIVDANTFQILKRFDMREKSKEAGEEWIYATARPMVLAPDDRFIFFQVSFYHGFFEFELEKGGDHEAPVASYSGRRETVASPQVPAALGPPWDHDQQRRPRALRRGHDGRIRGDRGP